MYKERRVKQVTVLILFGFFLFLLWFLINNQIQSIKDNSSNTLKSSIESVNNNLLSWVNIHKREVEILLTILEEDGGSLIKLIDYSSFKNYYLLDVNRVVLDSNLVTLIGKKLSHLDSRNGIIQRVKEGEIEFIPLTIRGGNPYLYYVVLRGSSLLLLEMDITEEYRTIVKPGWVGESGESYLFDKSGGILTELRHLDDLISLGLVTRESYYSFKLKDPEGNLLKGYIPHHEREDLPDTAIVHHAIEGVKENKLYPHNDYRGVPVYASWFWNSDLGIGIGSKIDESEITRLLLNSVYSTVAILAVFLMIFWVINKLLVGMEVENQSLKQKYYEKYHTLFDWSMDSLFIIDIDSLKIVDLNNASKSYFQNYKETEDICELLNLYSTLSELELKTFLEDGKETGEASLEIDFTQGDQTIHSTMLVKKISINSRDVILLSVRDVTEKVESELKTEETLLKLGEAEKVAKLGSWELYRDSKDVWLSPETGRILQLEDSGYKNLSVILDFVPDEDYDKCKNAIINCFHEGEFFSISHKLVTNNGELIFLKNSFYPQMDENNRVFKIMGIIQDITKIKEYETEIKIYKEHLEEIVEQRTEDLNNEKVMLNSLINSLPTLFFLLDRDGHIIMSNKSFLDCTGFSEPEIKGKHISSIVPEEQRDLLKKAFIDIQKIGRTQFEVEIITEFQVAVPFLLTINKFSQKNELFIVIGTDLSDLRAAMDEIIKLSLAVEQNPTAIMVCNLKGNIEYINQAFTKITGYEVSEVIGKSPSLLKSGLTPEKTYDELWDSISKGKNWKGEFINKTKSGEIFWEEASIFPIISIKGEIKNYIALKEDITEKKILLEDIEASERRYRFLFEQAGDAIVLINPVNLSLVEFNNEACRVLGYDRDNLAELMMEDIESPNNIIRFSVHSEIVMEKGHDSYETTLIGAKNEIINAWINSRIIVIDGIEYIQSIWRDITDIRTMEKELIEAKERAEESTRAKSMFLANMSHEIRTPMNSVIGFIELSLESESINSVIKEYLTVSLTSAKSLLSIINDILDVSKLESGRMEIEERTFNFKREVDEIITLFDKSARDKNIELKSYISPEIPEYIVGDPIRIRQILLNLLNNSIKFTSEGWVKLDIGKNEEKLILKVTDTGIGMSEEQLSRIFNPFTQADTSTARKFGGTGLGTTISRNLTSLMNGKIFVESEVGKGTTFTVELPLKSGSREKTAYPESSTYIEEKPESGVKKINILMAEDVEENARLVSIRLNKMGHSLTVVKNGQEAVDEVFNGSYDLVLMDVQMPVMDGLEATREIRSRERGRRIPIIALTANVMEDERRSCLEAGMDKVLSKPVDFNELAAILGTAEIEDEKQESDNNLHSRVINIQEGLELWQDSSVYYDVLEKFVDNYSDSGQIIKELYDSGKYEELKTYSHKIKGAAGNLCLPALFKESSEIEVSVKSGNYRELEKLVNRFNRELIMVCSRIKEVTKTRLESEINHIEREELIKEIDDFIIFISRGDIDDIHLELIVNSLKSFIEEEEINKIKRYYTNLDFISLKKILEEIKSRLK